MNNLLPKQYNVVRALHSEFVLPMSRLAIQAPHLISEVGYDCIPLRFLAVDFHAFYIHQLTKPVCVKRKHQLYIFSIDFACL